MTSETKDGGRFIVQGTFGISDKPGEYLMTILGSCVAVCLHDPDRRIGGLNHFLLPGTDNTDMTNMKYGVNAMELLINSLMKKGASRSGLVAKVFGGARMTPGLTDIGQTNAEFARGFLEDENIPILGGSTGGVAARKIRFFPEDGRVQQRLVNPEGAGMAH
ncbi:chemotaxis protein CheD [Mesobacterium pallidum]|uniref:chemotaxis protein CheD n=1 Tax=Mesobacterium pallidum TaxID=2872037 RepID=UPI001EE39613|nr:chemotaxis protein CheD [Mesobacterium pallidum]